MHIGEYQTDFSVLLPYMPQLGQGALLTLWISVLSLLLSFPLGLGGSLLRRSPNRLLRGLTAAYVEIFRNIPIIVVLYLLFFVLPANGVPLTGWQAGVLGLTLNSTAFVIEICRGGLSAIPAGQYEAAQALSLSRSKTFSKVILPQLLRVVFPSLGNQVVMVVLGSAQASIIGVAELTYRTQSIGSVVFRYFEVFLVAALFYIICVQLINLIWRLLGKRLVKEIVMR
ncbi:amino acid ABC transporter permease [Sodalis sp. dw_96]|uniref:amino acid ABC transporter permease n=1 Tax=Sodalis sp. dw_96 TaxID=2719794 RepID=UPI001BD68E45|nr:amino acid ABC transporter permease [Sodalis sp. dw_96]